MYNEDVSTPTDFPVEESKRWSTDICCTYISGIFALVLFILACVFFNSSNFNSAYFSGSINGKECNPQLIFIADARNSSSQFCVQSCPNDYYNINGICWPQNQENASLFAQNPILAAIQDYASFKTALVWALLFAFSISSLWLMVSQLLPIIVPLLSIRFAVTTLIAIGVLALILPQSGFFNENSACKCILIVVVFGIALILTFMGVMYRSSLKLQGIFLDYSRRFINENTYVFLYFPFFLVLLIGLVTLFIFQHCAFSSKSHTNGNFYDFSNPGLLGWLNIIQFIWGLQFLRDASNYCISGAVVDWYWVKKSNHWYTPIKRLVLKNWGSLAAGSFLNAFFELPTLLVQLLRCHKGTCCNRAGESCDSECFCFDYMFNLIRTDSYTYMNLSAIPYCNSARQCAKICHFNDQFVGNYNPIKHYRYSTYIFLVAISSLMGYIFAYIRLTQVSFWHIFTIIVSVYAIISWLISISVDAAESISTNFFVEHYESHEYEFMQKAIPSFRKQVEHYGKKQYEDGNC